MVIWQRNRNRNKACFHWEATGIGKLAYMFVKYMHKVSKCQQHAQKMIYKGRNDQRKLV